MRIATSNIYAQQLASINDLNAQILGDGENLSTGKSLHNPSDDPTRIGTDLGLRSTIQIETQQTKNIEAGTGQLTSTDNALANLTSVMQSVRTLAINGANDLISASGRKDIANEVDQYLQQTVALANTQYNGAYLFAGNVQLTSPPVTTQGTPIATIAFSGDLQTAAPMLINGQQFQLSPTLQQAFNYSATDGSPSIFGALATLRDTLSSGLVTDESAQAINQKGSVLYAGSTAPPASTLAAGALFAIPPTPDSAGNYSISVNNTDSNGQQHVIAYTFGASTAIDDGVAVPPLLPTSSIVSQINANTAATGLFANFNTQTQRLSITNKGGGAFSVTDEPSTGATNTSNFTSAFKINGSATLPSTVSTQLGDIDNALTVVLNARSLVGSRINAFAQLSDQVSTDINDNTTVQSGIEDISVASATTQLTATQLALNSSYSATTRLESKDLFDYL